MSVDTREPLARQRTGTPWHVPVALLAVVAVWGAAFSAIKVLLAELTPGELTFGRLLVAALTFTVLWLPRARRDTPPRRRGDLPRLVLLGLTGYAGYHYALNWGEQYVSAGVASILVASMPVMTALAAAWFLAERLTARRIAGVVIAFAGVTALVLASGGGLEVRRLLGLLVTLAAPATWAVYTIVGKGLAGRYDGVRLNLLASWIGVVATAPFGATAVTALPRLSLAGWLWLVYLGALSTAVAYAIYAWSLRTWSASAVASFVYLVPVASLLWAWALLGEVPGWGTLLGGALVIAGVVLVQARRREVAGGGG